MFRDKDKKGYVFDVIVVKLQHDGAQLAVRGEPCGYQRSPFKVTFEGRKQQTQALKMFENVWFH